MVCVVVYVASSPSQEMPSTDATVLALSEEAQNMAELRAQNDNLRSAIRMMREEMEGVGHQQNASVATDSATARSGTEAIDIVDIVHLFCSVDCCKLEPSKIIRATGRTSFMAH